MRGKVAGLMTLLVLVIASTSFAAVCPQQIAEIGNLTGGNKFEPMRVAVGPSGLVYVADARNDMLNAYNSLGEIAYSIYVQYPQGLAVDASGKVYVGSVDKNGNAEGAVTVYDASLNAMYMLGAGMGEFESPQGIATDADWVYVADTFANNVKIYNGTDGSYVSSINGLVKPNNIIVDPSTGNLLISDRSLALNNCAYVPAGQLCSATEKGLGVGIKEYTSGGTFVRAFDLTYGFTADTSGVLALIGGIVMDSAGRVIASDRVKNELHVFDANGARVCVVPYTFTPGANPQGLAATGDGRIFVGASGRVIELGLDTYTKSVVSPSVLEYSAKECGAQPGAKTVTISNDGPGTMDFTVASDQTWLTTSVSSGTISGVGSTDVIVNVDRSGLAVGIHTGTLTISSDSGDQTVAVSLDIQAATIGVSPSSLVFAVGEAAKSLSVESSGTSWSAASDSSWLSISPMSGPSSVVAQVNVDAGGLAGGIHGGNITVNADCGTGGPITVPVTLEVVAGGTIQVATNLGTAAFAITGPANYSGSGLSYTVSGAASGTYMVEFIDIAGYKTPASCSLSVTNGATVTCNGSYIDLRKKLNILASMGDSIGKTTNALKILGINVDGTKLELGTVLLQDESSNRYWDNAIVASGDVDGDGAEEVIVSHDIGIITGFEIDGTQIVGLDFRPFADRAYVDVAVADLDGDGRDEIVVSALNWSANGAAVRVFSYDGSTVNDTGANFFAYTGANWVWSQSNERRGARIAVGDVDGDGAAEILTVQGGGYSRHHVYARTFKVDASGGAGKWSVRSTGAVEVNDVESYYSDITAGDINGDGTDEIIISDAPGLTAAMQNIRVMAFSAAGDRLLDFTVDSVRGVEVAAGDVNFDGKAEIVVGEGAFREGDSSRVRVFDAQGRKLSDFMAFDAKVFGVRVATGQLVSY